DPYYEYRFKNSNDDNYDLIHKDDFDNNNIFKLTYNEKVTTYSVDAFYEEMNKTVGFAKLVQLLKLDYVYALKDQFLDEDKVEEYENDLNTAIDGFNNGENESYPTEIGEATFLLANYGYSNKEDILKYNKVASSVLSSYLSQTVFDEWATNEHALNTEKINVLNNLLAAGNKKYNDIFSIKIDHLLIYIDDDGDGSPDDPKKFLEKGIDVDDFNKELLALSKAIYNETKCEKLTSANNSVMDILNRVVRNYYRDDALYSDPNDNWSNYKKYNLQLKVESLSSSGNTTDSNVSNYVKDFADYVEKLYQTVKTDKLDTDDGDKPTFYFNYLESNTDKKQPLSIEEICATEFGYHLIIVDDYEETDSTEKTSSSDPNGYQKNIEILLNEKDADDTEDNIYLIIPDTYNDKKTEATLNQFATYYLQSQKGITSSLDSSIRSLLSSMFDEAISRYTSRNFQEYLLYKDMGVHIKDSKLTTALTNYEGYLKRVSQNYDKEDTLADWYSDAFNWKRPY
nr:hypothetical protein [Anaeroplasmataceae bacterium]